MPWSPNQASDGQSIISARWWPSTETVDIIGTDTHPKRYQTFSDVYKDFDKPFLFSETGRSTSSDVDKTYRLKQPSSAKALSSYAEYFPVITCARARFVLSRGSSHDWLSVVLGIAGILSIAFERSRTRALSRTVPRWRRTAHVTPTRNKSRAPSLLYILSSFVYLRDCWVEQEDRLLRDPKREPHTRHPASQIHEAVSLDLHATRLDEHAHEEHPMTAIGPSNFQYPNSMVSHHQPQLPPPPTDRALTARRPSSVSSRSTTRRHHTSRSHHGSQSYRPQNEFPNFAQTGDVELIIQVDGEERRYFLHRLILTQCSGFFEAGTSEGWSRAQTVGTPQEQSNSLARIREEDEGTDVGRPSGQRQVWRYELDWGNGQEDMPMLVQKPSPSSLFGAERQSLPPPAIPHRPPPPANGSFFRNQPAMQSAAHIPSSQSLTTYPDNSLLTDYDNLFRIFYNYAPSLDSINIATTYLQCKSLLSLADMYDALEVVGPRIDHHLLQFQSRLWKQIAKYPPSYLKLGYLARSKVIFSEALIHVVGQWPSGSRQLSHAVPEAVLDLIEDKVDELTEKKAKIEAQLFKITLLTSRGERVSPTTNYTEWLALSLWRQYLSDQTSLPPPKPPPTSSSFSSRHRAPAPPPPPPPPQTQSPPSSSFYRALFTASQSYLAHDECKKFIRLAPLPDKETSTREALKRFERKLDEIKAQAREIVRPLMRSLLELDVSGGGGLGYLTCTKVEDGEWPWD